MNKLVLIAAVSALALGAQAGVIALNSTWRTDGANTTLSSQSASGASVVQVSDRNAYFYQRALDGDFTAEPFGIGDTATMTFTTTMDVAAGANDSLDYRFSFWDETSAGGGGASVRMDWGAPAGDTMSAGVGDALAIGAIGSQDEKATGSGVPSNVFNASNEVSTVTLEVTKVATNLFNVSFTWDDVTISANSISPANGVDIASIGALGIRLFGTTSNEYTVSNLSVEVGPAAPGTTLTYQLGGDSDVWNQGWGENVITNSGVTPTEYSWSFGAPYYYEELSNVVFTVTAVETNDAMYIGNAFLAGTNGHSSRLDTNEMVKVRVSYVDPDNKLLDLKVHSFGPYWNNNADEETLFSDGSAVFSITNSDNGVMQSYDATGLEQLSMANTATWSMSVYETNNTTFSSLGGFKLEYTVDADYIEPPPLPLEPPHGDVAFSDTWDFYVATSNMAVLAQSSDGFSVAMTNSLLAKRLIYKMGTNSFDAAFQVGETATWSFTATVGSALALNAEDMGLQGSLWDADISSDNGVSFQVDWGTPAGETMKLSASDVATSGNIGAVSGADISTGVPSNALDAQGKSADFVMVIERTTKTDMFVSLSYDDVTLTNSYSTADTFDSLDELGFRFRQTDDNALIISDMTLVITNPDFDYYAYWAVVDKGLEEGVNDDPNDDPDFDAMENLLEYALGGNPMVDDAAVYLPVSNQDNGYLNLVYRRRLDAATRGLDYNVYSSTDLVLDPITSATEEAGSVALDADFESVTNRVPTDVEAQQFMQLEVSEP